MAWFIFFHQKILLYLCKFISPNRISQTDWIYTSLSRGQHFIFGSSDSYIWLTHWHWEQIDHNLKSSKSSNLVYKSNHDFQQNPRALYFGFFEWIKDTAKFKLCKAVLFSVGTFQRVQTKLSFSTKNMAYFTFIWGLI